MTFRHVYISPFVAPSIALRVARASEMYNRHAPEGTGVTVSLAGTEAGLPPSTSARHLRIVGRGPTPEAAKRAATEFDYCLTEAAILSFDVDPDETLALQAEVQRYFNITPLPRRTA